MTNMIVKARVLEGKLRVRVLNGLTVSFYKISSFEALGSVNSFI